MRFRFPNIDTFSFWLGFILATLSWLLLSMLRPAFRHLRATVQTKQSEHNAIIHTSSGMFRLFYVRLKVIIWQLRSFPWMKSL